MEKRMDDGSGEVGEPVAPIMTSGLGIYKEHLINMPPVFVARINMTHERYMSEGAPKVPLLKANMWDMPELLCLYCNDLARRKFLQYGAHEEVFILFASDAEGGKVAFAQPSMERDGESFYRALRNDIRGQDIEAIVHIVEVWTYVPKGPNDHTWKQIQEGEIAISQLKESDKAEALMVSVACRGGAECGYSNAILRTKDGIALADPVQSSYAKIPRTMLEGFRD